MSVAVDVIVVAFGAPELLDACLTPLDGQLPVVVVDNSSDPAVQAVAEHHDASYIDPGENLGFAAGVNIGLAHRNQPAADVLLLNPDASITPEGVAQLHRHLHAADGLACVAPAQVDPVSGDPARVVWQFPTPMGAWVEALGLGRLRRNDDFLIGSVLLVRAAALADVGGFDQHFFLYAEETDWQRRATDLGWRVALCPEVEATHIGAGTSGGVTERDIYFHASNERYMRKHFGNSGWWIFRAGVMVGALVRALFLPGDRGRRSAARFHLYRTGPSRAESRLKASQVL
jgi:GT2 family glycosyltransferase